MTAAAIRRAAARRRPDTALRCAPLLPVALVAGIGIVCADGGHWWLAGLAAIGLAGSGWLSRRCGWRVGGILVASALALSAFAGWHAHRLETIRQFPLAGELDRGHAIEVEAVGWFASRPEVGERSVSGVVELEKLHIGDEEIPCRHRVPAWIRQIPDELDYGSRLRFQGLIRPLEGPVAPGAFDPSTFHFRHSGSLGRLEIRRADSLERLPGHSGSRLRAVAIDLRRHLEAGLLAGLAPPDEPYARLVAAMSLGARESSPADLEDWFRRSGTMHLFAVSGLHVGIVGVLLLGAVLLLGVPRRYAVLAVIPLVLFYALVTGLRPSALRAAIMLSLLLAGFAVKERPRLVNSLAFAALLLLAADTQQLFLPGFQLSFAVLLAIALFVPLTQRMMARPWLSDPFLPRALLGPVRVTRDRLVTAFSAMLAVSLVSWIGSLGPLAWHFRSVSPVGIVANLLLVPLAGAMVGLALGSLLCHAAHLSWLNVLANKLNVGLAIAATGTAQFFAELPGAHVHTGQPGAQPIADETVTIDAMGTRGEGAVLISLPPEPGHRRSSWMVDCGGTDTYRRHVLPMLRSRGVNRLDALFLTHGDIGHIGAGTSVLSQLRPRFLFESPGENRSPAYPEIIELAASLPVARTTLAAGQRLEIGAEVEWHVLAPRRHAAGRLADDRSLVMRLDYRDWRVLFTADAGFATEKHLLDAGVDLDADVWIRGQHRHAPGGLPAFLEAVSPAGVVSTHAEFPPEERISSALRTRLEDRGIRLFDLERDGVVTIALFPGGLRVRPHGSGGESLHLRPAGAP